RLRPMIGNLANVPAPAEVGSTLALALLRNDEVDEALEVVRRVRVLADGRLPDSFRVVEALVLAASGSPAEAVRIAGRIDRSQILALEYALIEPLRAD
ncbi:MAG: hypothetical protein ACLFU2_14625, partial [Opitutales bacterium]